MADLLRLATAGSVDDGKSTLIGRLLYDAKAVLADQLEHVEQVSAKRGTALDLALLTDGLRAEREQGITIDVAYRPFATARRRFIIADTPGHAQYTRNMVTGASTADLALILVDVRHGMTEQSRRHTAIAKLLGIRHVVVCVNKMDLAGYAEEAFDAVVREVLEWSARLDLHDIAFIPISALHGDNVVDRSEHMPWYGGEPLLSHLETVPLDRVEGPARLPVQYVIRHERRLYAGQVAAGTLRVGDEIAVLPAGGRSRIAAIEGPAGPLEEAVAPLSIAVALEDELDVSRGDLIAFADGAPVPGARAHRHGLLAGRRPGAARRPLPAQARRAHGPRAARRDRAPARPRGARADAGRPPGAQRPRPRAPAPGRAARHRSVRRQPRDRRVHPHRRGHERHGRGRYGRRVKTANTRWHDGAVTPQDRAAALGFKGATIWFTGLPASGKSTLAVEVEALLVGAGRPALRLDGDNLRHGLNGDLGFSPEDRAENVRRTAHAAALLAEAGVVALVALVSPYASDRALARAMHETAGVPFREVWVSTGLAECERRDPKGLYARARAGELPGLTGVGDVYEVPESPDLAIGGAEPIPTAAARVLATLG